MRVYLSVFTYRKILQRKKNSYFLFFIECFSRLTNKTHLYVMSTTNLFYLEGLSDRIESRDLEINLFEIVHRDTNFAKYRTFSIEASIQIRDHDLFYHRMRSAISLLHSSNHSIKNERRIYIDRSFE